MLMEPANIHVKLNVSVQRERVTPFNRHFAKVVSMSITLQIDCKVENLPDKLFPMIKEEMFKHEHWESLLAPRIILGIWHVSPPRFIGTQRKGN